jgi:hypothetical protein
MSLALHIPHGVLLHALVKSGHIDTHQLHVLKIFHLCDVCINCKALLPLKAGKLLIQVFPYSLVLLLDLPSIPYSVATLSLPVATVTFNLRPPISRNCQVLHGMLVSIFVGGAGNILHNLHLG